ncbi:hypothetical protein GCM10023116_15460 [Kistimonas scapharcae]|uniref:Anti-bacteriophage protein A/HamA C-terminal domain-containing protein n=1 Tax=Kistimonas scapharcae TaxID=1036133 RepID=A0ABP8V058_9GAMM
MKHIFDSSSFVEVSRYLDEACDWLERISVNYSKTRIAKYKKIYSDLAKLQILDDLEKSSDVYSFPVWMNASHEVAELMRIHEGLNNLNDADLVKRLNNSLKGNEFFSEDKANRSGRDIGFELSIASKFAKQNLPIDFGHDADLKVNLPSGDIFVECKRLKSRNQIQKRIKEGLTQLRKRYKTSKHPATSKGILVLSISKVVNSDLGLLEANDDIELGNKAHAICHDFLKKYQTYWQKSRDSRTMGVAIVLDCPGVIKSRNMLVTAHQIVMTNTIPTNSDNYPFFMEIARSVFGKA